MRALITNDDGIDSRGLTVLAEVAAAAGFEVVVAAPAREASGASASLIGYEATGDELLYEERTPPGLADGIPSFAVQAAPALITFVGANGAFGPAPDLVLSGVNRGANVGNAVLHSGTVGAALSAMTHGIPGVAVSLDADDPQHWATASQVTARVVDWVLPRLTGDEEWRPGVVNVNVPDVPAEELRGVRRAPLASFGAVRGRVYEADGGRLTPVFGDSTAPDEPGSDAQLLTEGWATVTMLRSPWFDADAALPGD
ncbi:5'/3'-nucleotidase SurE [Sanguibacter suaedae]|uniref:5'-nucleotidase n=1 Tax=Sanguibacter suaedae TaxID=2795737 RepID=A0A934I1I1_9MICO|nr:5'/3'-nucleotidase SurE [Sanguibacter suaedae]MBI9113478.1 5'/3'-nucleotidase SurE [Sanguibacter suaedae]